jgi:hypothetical protein
MVLWQLCFLSLHTERGWSTTTASRAATVALCVISHFQPQSRMLDNLNFSFRYLLCYFCSHGSLLVLCRCSLPGLVFTCERPAVASIQGSPKPYAPLINAATQTRFYLALLSSNCVFHSFFLFRCCACCGFFFFFSSP